MQQKTILGIECSSELCSVSLLHNGHVNFQSKLSPREHAYLVLPFAEALLSDQGLEFSDLQAVVFGQGPGAFTGLRVAASMAQGLALAHDIPLFSACSLEVLALQQSSHSASIIVSVLDARMSELYWAVYSKEAGQGQKLQLIKGPELDSPEGLVQALAELNLSGAMEFIGPGCRHLRSLLHEGNCSNVITLDDCAESFPHARELLSLERLTLDSGSNDSELPMPVYVRNDVAAKSKKPLV